MVSQPNPVASALEGVGWGPWGLKLLKLLGFMLHMWLPWGKPRKLQWVRNAVGGAGTTQNAPEGQRKAGSYFAPFASTARGASVPRDV